MRFNEFNKPFYLDYCELLINVRSLACAAVLVILFGSSSLVLANDTPQSPGLDAIGFSQESVNFSFGVLERDGNSFSGSTQLIKQGRVEGVDVFDVFAALVAINSQAITKEQAKQEGDKGERFGHYGWLIALMVVSIIVGEVIAEYQFRCRLAAEVLPADWATSRHVWWRNMPFWRRALSATENVVLSLIPDFRWHRERDIYE